MLSRATLIAIVTVVAVVVALLLWPRKVIPEESQLPTTFQTYLFQVIDTEGKKSYIHDSNVPVGSPELVGSILKEETNNYTTQTLGMPQYILYGTSAQTLSDPIQLTPEQLTTDDDQYTITVPLSAT